jgi:hypothetical protein
METWRVVGRDMIETTKEWTNFLIQYEMRKLRALNVLMLRSSWSCDSGVVRTPAVK